MPPCVIKASDKLEFIDGVLHVNGKPKSLEGCKFEGQPRFSIPVVDVAPPPAPSLEVIHISKPPILAQQAPPPAPAAPAPAPAHETQAPASGELAQIAEIIDMAKTVMNMPPLLAVAIVAAFVLLKLQKMKKDSQEQQGECKGHSALTSRVAALENAQYDRRIAALEDDSKRKLFDQLNELRKDQAPPPPRPAERHKFEE